MNQSQLLERIERKALNGLVSRNALKAIREDLQTSPEDSVTILRMINRNMSRNGFTVAEVRALFPGVKVGGFTGGQVWNIINEQSKTKYDRYGRYINRFEAMRIADNPQTPKDIGFKIRNFLTTHYNAERADFQVSELERFCK